ncbi:MAG: hypothetical protein COB51_11245 [Moraxellaceae bacterium]|nr:MAG: hypothetical protein COB51_11245 [Moraxellaceae bacterium]
MKPIISVLCRTLLLSLIFFMPVNASSAGNEGSSPALDNIQRQSSTDLALLLEAAEKEQGLVVSNDSSGISNYYSSEAFIKKMDNERFYVTALCGLCIFSLVIILYFLKDREHSARDLISAAGLTLIIFSTVLLVLIVNTSEQLTAAIGILGAISGYLFRSVSEDSGRYREKSESKNN